MPRVRHAAKTRAVVPQSADMSSNMSSNMSSKSSSDTSYEGVLEARVEPPIHPVPHLQGPFEESMMEAMADSKDGQDMLDAESRRAKLIENHIYERVVAGRWKQKPGEKFHPLWKLSAQLSFGVHLLAHGLAKSDEDVMAILQNHVDDIDNFLERTSEDFDLALKDIQERLYYLRLPLEHIDVFDNMLEDKNFRYTIVTGNEKIEHVVVRTTSALKDALKDCRKGLDATKSLGQYLESIKGTWKTDSPEFVAVYSAMVGNCEGWNAAFGELIGKADRLSIALVQLTGVVDEMQRRCGIISRRGLLSSRSSREDISSSGQQPRKQKSFRLSRYHPDRQNEDLVPTPLKQLPSAPQPVLSPAEALQARPSERVIQRAKTVRADPPAYSSHSQTPVETPSQTPKRMGSLRNRLKKRPSGVELKRQASLRQKQEDQLAQLADEPQSPRKATDRYNARPEFSGAISEKSSQLSTAVASGAASTEASSEQRYVQDSEAPASLAQPLGSTTSTVPVVTRKPSFTKRIFGRKLPSISRSRSQADKVQTDLYQSEAHEIDVTSPPSAPSSGKLRKREPRSPTLSSPDPSHTTPPSRATADPATAGNEYFTALPEQPSPKNSRPSTGKVEAPKVEALSSHPPQEVTVSPGGTPLRIEVESRPRTPKTPADSGHAVVSNPRPASAPRTPSTSHRPSRFTEESSSDTEPSSIASPRTPYQPPMQTADRGENQGEKTAALLNDIIAMTSPPATSHSQGSGSMSPRSATERSDGPTSMAPPRARGQSSLPSLTRTQLSPPTEAPPPPPPGGRRMIDVDYGAVSAFSGERVTPMKTGLKKVSSLNARDWKKALTSGSSGSGVVGSPTSQTSQDKAGPDRDHRYKGMGNDGVWVSEETPPQS